MRELFAAVLPRYARFDVAARHENLGALAFGTATQGPTTLSTGKIESPVAGDIVRARPKPGPKS